MNNVNKLIKAAKDVRKNSYAIFSNFKVGAAILTKDGKIYSGTNIESASYGLTICAERSCLFNAYSNGVRKKDIIAMAIVGESKDSFTACGACRQVMAELLNKKTVIYIINLATPKKIIKTDIDKLLPNFISSKDIK